MTKMGQNILKGDAFFNSREGITKTQIWHIWFISVVCEKKVKQMQVNLLKGIEI